MKIPFNALRAPLALGIFLFVGLASAPAQSLLGSSSVVSPSGVESATLAAKPAGEPLASAEMPDSAQAAQFAEGRLAIDQGRWADAVRIFSSLTAQHANQADRALYWQAYAESKLSHTKPALADCATLRASYPASHWLDDCSALEIEIRAAANKPVEIPPGASDDTKLLALNALMRQNAPHALAEIQKILNGEPSEQLRKQAQFLLSQYHTDATYAQIVRLSYVDGDVRIQRGEESEKAAGATWEQAEAGIPLESGFSLVTGQGRAEIEFENASTIYLAENSVLLFNDLHTTAGIPYTGLALLSGTVTLHIQPFVAGEEFVLKTPTDRFTARFPDSANYRITSYADAMAVTQLDAHAHGEIARALKIPSMPATVAGNTVVLHEGWPIDSPFPGGASAFADWDKWVAARVEQRTQAIAQMMNQSGLTTPIPGMADLKDQGAFFDCGSYGTCWEPNAFAALESRAIDAETGTPAEARRGPSPQVRPSSAARSNQNEVSALDFPCLPAALRYRSQRDPVSGNEIILPTALAQPFSEQPYAWALCHAGGWVQRNGRYVWVSGPRRHHLEPVRWIKSGRVIGFVPLHPYDVKGQPPVNRTGSVFTVGGKDSFSLQLVSLDATRPTEYLEDPPREFRTLPAPPLAPAEAPRMESRTLSAALAGRGEARPGGTLPITFNDRTHNFVIARQQMHESRNTSNIQPLGTRSSSFQSHAPSFPGSSAASAHGAYSSGSYGGSSHGSSGGGISSSGGGSHASSSSSSSTASPSASSASSSASSAGAASGSHK